MVHKKKLSSSEIIFFVDSQAAIKAIASETIRSKAVAKCRGILNNICNTNQVKFCWVPGHMYSNIEGNDIADELGRKGSISIETVEANHIRDKTFPSA